MSSSDINNLRKLAGLNPLTESVDTAASTKQVVSEKYMGHARLSSELKQKGAKDPEALASWIGREKYGKEKFQAAAAKGKKMGEGLARQPDPYGPGERPSQPNVSTPTRTRALPGMPFSTPATREIKTYKDNYGDDLRPDTAPIGEDDMEEGNLFTGNLAKARAQGKKRADLDGDGDIETVREGAKPDYIDLDKDGNRKESMKKAAADKKKSGVAEAKADPTSTWVVYDGDKVKRFKTHPGAKAYAEQHGGKVASSAYYADKIQGKKDVAEAGNQSPHAKLAQLKAKYNQMLKSPNPNITTLRRIRDEIIKLEFDLGIKEGVAEAFIAPALSAANANAEFDRTKTFVPRGYKGRVDTEVSGKEEYRSVMSALKKLARAEGQHIEAGLIDTKMSVFSKTMDSESLSDFIDMALQDFDQGVAEGSDQYLVYISKSKVREFEEWMESEGLETEVPKKDVGKFIVYDYSGQDVITKSYADDWNEKPQGVAEGSDNSKWVVSYTEERKSYDEKPSSVTHEETMVAASSKEEAIAKVKKMSKVGTHMYGFSARPARKSDADSDDIAEQRVSEETKETSTGRVHKAGPGGYGRRYDLDDDGDDKKKEKKAEPEVKRGRGRPKKGADSETGQEKKWDFSAFLKPVKLKDPKGKKIGGRVVSKMADAERAAKKAEKDEDNQGIYEAAPAKQPLGTYKGGVWTADPPKKGEVGVPVPSPDEGPTTPTPTPRKPVKPVTAPQKKAELGVADDSGLAEMLNLAGLNRETSSKKLAECGDMNTGGMSYSEQEGKINVSTNQSSDGNQTITITADGDAAQDLAQMLKLSGMLSGGKSTPVDEEYANEPQTEKMSLDSMLHSGDDLHKEKASYSDRPYRGDNPMAESLEQKLWEEFQKAKKQ